ncbi:MULTISPECIES: DUF4357 domain-containing protein [unclassified Marinovum]|uniref:DUF4357 domain-containing protein n=1 Tax=unclassified Marinovum TaxID=2647166 RepID=UPI003EDC35E6
MDQFEFEDGNAKATGSPMEIKKRPRFKVFKGSTARRYPSRTERRYDDERRRLRTDGTLTDHPTDPGLLVFTRDYEANSASMAAGVISGGGNFSGPEKWFEVASGEPFNEWLGNRL